MKAGIFKHEIFTFISLLLFSECFSVPALVKINEKHYDDKPPDAKLEPWYVAIVKPCSLLPKPSRRYWVNI